jgi:hypothetical protein
MTTTYDQAINLLQVNPAAYATKEDLLRLVQNVTLDTNAGQTQGRVTVLYGGMVSSTGHSSDVISAMVANGSDVRVIDKTQVSKLLQSDDFLAALGRTAGNAGSGLLLLYLANRTATE